MWGFWKKKDHTGHVLNDEDVDKSHISRLEKSIRKLRIEHLKQKLQRMKDMQEEQMLEEQLEDLENDFYGPEEGEDDKVNVGEAVGAMDNPDALLMGLLGNVLGHIKKPNAQQAAPPIQQQQTAQKKHYSDQELQALVSSIPEKWRPKIKAMSAEQILQLVPIYAPDEIKEMIAGADEDSIVRAIKLLKS